MEGPIWAPMVVRQPNQFHFWPVANCNGRCELEFRAWVRWTDPVFSIAMAKMCA